ncbi:MAG: alcohol dehydrogenase catalytic domain-containing protein [Deltaproteobacteria bacterium]|nr:alcohol dehydrogenase catalytic domain-containing protein [Deltaproteobacteria bacterium]
MKALVLEAYNQFAYKDVPDPVLRAADDLLVRVKAAAICGSDVHGMDGSTGRRRPPIVMGHEAAGEVVAVGSAVKRFKVGDRVTFDSTEYCGACFFCRRGEVNLCDDRQVLGVSCAEYSRSGTFAEYVVVPERIAYRLPEGVDFVEAALAEPAAVAAHAVTRTPIALGDSLLIVGTGLIGLLLLQILRVSAPGLLVALDTDPQRREAALRFGADAAFDPALPETANQVLSLTFGRGADHAFEAVGATAPLRTAIDLTRKGGTVTLIGNISPTVELPLQSVVTRQLTLLGSCATAGEYPLLLDLMAQKKINVRALVSAVAPLAEGAVWFDRLYRREPGLLKVVLEP